MMILEFERKRCFSMIGSGLSKLAKEYGLETAHGVAYGNLRGFAATLSEGSGYKRVVLTTRFPDPAQKTAMQNLVNSQELTKTYRVRELVFSDNCVSVIFNDTIGTMDKIRAFLDWFLPELHDHGATSANVCTECGCDILSGCWKLVGGTAYHFHEGCANRVKQALDVELEQQQSQDGGSYLKGLLGALGGAAIGAIVWALVLLMGYVAGLVGFVIGWLAEKGYNLLHGKRGKAKVLILIVAVVFGVVLGTFGADALSLAISIGNGELPGFTYGDIPGTIIYLLGNSEEYVSATVGNIVLGLVFAALGVWILLVQAHNEVSGVPFIDLK